MAETCRTGTCRGQSPTWLRRTRTAWTGSRCRGRDCDLGGQAGVCDDELSVRGERPAARFARAGTRGRTASPPDPLRRRALGFRQRFLDQRLDVVEASSGGRASNRPPPPRSQCARATRAASSGGLDACRNRRAAVRRIEERQLVRAKAEHRHAQRLEQLERRRDVQQRLDSSRDDERLRASELAEIGGHVRRMRKAAVHAAEPAGSHEPDAGSAADRERSADGRRADGALHDARSEIARPYLACAARRNVRALPP